MPERFSFRDIEYSEHAEAARIESICFPPHEACKPDKIEKRIRAAADLFMVAWDEQENRIAGFLNGLATNEEEFRDEFFLDEKLNDPTGANIMILGLDVLPEYRNQGLARKIVEVYGAREKAKGRQALILTCLEELVPMYQKFGFEDLGIANSTWGDEEWHAMKKYI